MPRRRLREVRHRRIFRFLARGRLAWGVLLAKPFLSQPPAFGSQPQVFACVREQRLMRRWHLLNSIQARLGGLQLWDDGVADHLRQRHYGDPALPESFDGGVILNGGPTFKRDELRDVLPDVRNAALRNRKS